MSDVLVDVKPEVFISRVTLPDMSDHGRWIVERMRARYPQFQDSQLTNWLRSAIDDSDYFFARSTVRRPGYPDTSNAVALFQLIRETMSPIPAAVERFVLTRDRKNLDYLDEALALYGAAKRWAVNIGAEEMRLHFSDVTAKDVEDAIGIKVKTREVKFVPLWDKR